jgi:DNA-binding Xre family transcriptional regulator
MGRSKARRERDRKEKANRKRIAEEAMSKLKKKEKENG